MPAELFRTVAVRGKSTGRRLGAVPLSVAVHAAVLVAAITIPLIATTDELPPPRVPVADWEVTPLVDVPPAPLPPSAHRPALAPSQPAPPTVAPNGIPPEIAVDYAPPGVPEVPPGTVFGDLGVGQTLNPGQVEAPPPPAPKPSGPVRVGQVAMPRKVHHVAPIYPQLAIAARVEGTVTIEAIISTTGAVQNARVVHSVPLLDAAALEAVRQWMFTPTLLSGEPVPVILTVNVEFKLQR